MNPTLTVIAKRLYYIIKTIITLFFVSAYTTIYAGKVVVLVLDDSQSMYGDKYKQANLFIQMVAASLSDNDEFYLLQNSRVQRLSATENTINRLSRAEAKGSDGYNLLVPLLTGKVPLKEGDQLYILIAADGVWSSKNPDGTWRHWLYEANDRAGSPADAADRVYVNNYNLFNNDWGAFLNKYKPYIHFISIQDGNDHQNNSLKEILSQYPASKITQVDNNQSGQLKQALQSNLEKLNNSSHVRDFNVSSDGNTVVFTTPVSLKRVIIATTAINSTGSDLPQVVAVEGEENLQVTKQFSLSNKDVNAVTRTPNFQSALIAHVAKSSGNIAANKALTITFNKAVNKQDLLLLPVADVVVKIDASATKGMVCDEKNGICYICSYEETIELSSELKTSSSEVVVLPENVNCSIHYSDGSSNLQATVKNGKALIQLPAKKDTTYLTVRAECIGVFDVDYEKVITIVRTYCDTSTQLLSISEAGQNGKYCSSLSATTKDLMGKTLPAKTSEFDLFVDDVSKGYQVEIITVNESEWQICVIPKDFCECFAKEGPVYARLLRVKKGEPHSLGTPINLQIDNYVPQGTWWDRCKRLIFYLLLFIALVVYIIGLLRRKRFPPNGYIAEYDTVLHELSYKRYFSTNFFNRYLIPYGAESCTRHGMKFTALGSKINVIKLDKKSALNRIVDGERIEDKIDVTVSDGSIIIDDQGSKKVEYRIVFS